MIEFILAALALTGSPGPNTLSLAAVGAGFGRRGIRYMLGLTFGMLLVVLLTGTGVSALILAIPGIAPVVTAIAVAYFLYLAWRIATAPPPSARDTGASPPRWVEGMILSLINPKAYAAMAALFSGFTLVKGAPVQDIALKSTLAMATLAMVNPGWLWLGHGLTSAMRTPGLGRAINIAFAALLLISVAATTLL
ncbi:MAG: LysE family translocator [Paracoccaceae bacterium]|nr:LysE family translocator [Paracoccaceae bacterium]